MELWIRSQNRLKLIKVNGTISIEYSLEPNKNDYQIFVGLTYIGAYKNEERALEVLDEIQKLLQPQLIIKDSGKIIGSFEDTIIREGATYELKELSTYVYEMPSE